MKKTNKKDRRILTAALVVAGVTVAGSTFAWFTSKDEVTNRLSASAEYNVAIAETFQPPETWVPGQEINKDASAVNTGNVDAFVRMWLTGNMRLLQQNKTATDQAKWNATNAFGTALTGAADVTDSNISSMGLTKYKTESGTTYYFKTLDKTQTFNPGTNASTNAYGYGTQFSGAYSEVQAMQGSRLAYAPAGASYAFVTKEETKLPVYLSEDGGGATDVEATVPAGTLVIVNSSSAVPSTITSGVFAPVATSTTVTSASGAEYASTSTVYVRSDLPIITNVEYESFIPFTDGLYLFLRNEDDVTVTDPEFSGYYVTGTAAASAAGATFYALNTNTGGANRSDYTVKGATTATTDTPVQVTITDGVITTVAPTTNLELYTASYIDLNTDALKWYTNSDQTEIYVVYDSGNADATEFEGDNDIAVTISLANIGTTPESWTAIGAGTTAVNSYDGNRVLNASDIYDASKLTYYYNNDLEAGDTTAKLVDKVTLHKDVTNKAYLAFDFDLNVNLESVQVTFDQNGNEDDAAVNSGWAATSGTNATGATGTAAGKNPEITSITWTAS